MQVRALKTFRDGGSNKTIRPGEVFDSPDQNARQQIANGLVEEVVEEDPAGEGSEAEAAGKKRRRPRRRAAKPKR